MKARWILFCSLFVLLGNFVVSLVNMNELVQNRQWAWHSRHVLNLINKSKLLMSDAENEALVYLAGRRPDSSGFSDYVLSLQDTLRDLESELEDNPRQTARISALRSWVRTNMFNRTPDNNFWMVVRLKDGDRSDYAQFKKQMGKIQQEEEKLFNDRKVAVDDSVYRIYLTFFAALAIGSTCIITAYLVYSRDNKIRNTYDRKMSESNEFLKAADYQRQLLADLGQKALAGATCEDLMILAGEQLTDVLDVEFTKFLRLSEDGETFKMVAGTGWNSGLVPDAIGASDESQAGYALSVNHPVIVDDLRSETRFQGPNMLTQHGVVSGISVIIHGKGERPWGVLGVHSRKNRKFTEENVHFLQGVANIIGEAHQRAAYERDLTIAKEAAEAASKAKDQFLAVLSHEMRTPLTPCLLAASSMAIHPGSSEECRKAFSDIQRNLELEARLIDDLLDVMLIVKGKMSFHMTVIDAHHKIELAADICRPALVDKQIKLELHLDASQKFITADAARFQQVIWNLIKNAVKFTPDKGRITVRTYNVNESLMVEVVDTGIGITADVLPTVFDAFIQGERHKARRYGGLGLGLAISKAIIEGHKGEIRVESKGDGQGSKFVVCLPTTFVPSLELPEYEPPVRDANDSYRIFYVEDDHPTREVTAKLLESVGHTVTQAHSLAEAMKVNPDDHDILVSDIGLGDGTGLDLMMDIRHKGYKLPGMALSGYGTEEDVAHSLQVGFSEHLTKPVPFPTLEAAIKRVVGTQRRVP